MSREPELDLDALIIGGGPAGSACANRLARGGARVAIVEATDYSAFRIGEVIDSSAQSHLSSLGLEALETQAWASRCSGVMAKWGSLASEPRVPMLKLQGRSYRLDRNRFDQALFNSAEQAGAAGFTRSRVTNLEIDQGKWKFALQSSEGLAQGRTEWIVAATGRNRRAPGTPSQSKHRLDRLIAIAMIGGGENSEAHILQEALHLQAASSGWWYSITTPSGRIVVVFLTDADLLPAGKRAQSEFMLTQLCQVALPVLTTKIAETCLMEYRWSGFGAGSGIRTIGMAQNWIATGDALTAYDPLCGKGIACALGSGIETADLILDSSSHDGTARSKWADRVMRQYNTHAVERLTNYGLERRFSKSTFWRRRQD
ncbi:FAD-dependent oxidoreductase [Mesorhizobium sp. M0036]|uniref:NAD(P)/FAD-dependent oxidoreductase n=1 Tax=Mesorhizobium sp. M0036 TaxID=2956853 RepID=UPI00333B3577